MATIGVKIELEGAPKYSENMKQLTAQTKLYQAQVKRLTTEMSSGVSAFTKSITTSKALQQQLDAQKKQSQLLSEQIKKTTEAQGEDSAQVLRLKTQYENLQRAIAVTNQQLEAQGGVAGAIAAEFKEVGSKLDSIGEKMSSFGADLTKNVTGPILAVGAASLKAFDEVDGAYDTVIKKTGATGEALKGMTDIVNDIATDIPTSFENAAQSVGEVNTRFGLTGDALKELSKQFVEFADLNDTDVSSSIDTVQKALSAFGLGAESAGMLLDRLNKVGQDTGISVDKVASGLVSNAAAFKEMGLSIDEAATFMGQLEKSGANIESVMGGLSKALKKATSEGKPLDQALSELQDTIENGTGSMDGLSAAYDLFGKSAPQVYQAIKDGALDFDSLSSSIESAAGSVQKTFDATIDPTDEFQTHLNELKLVGMDIANTMMPTIEKALTKFSEIIKSISDAWGGMSEGQKDFVVKLAGIAAAVGPIIAVAGKLVSFIASVGTSIGTIIGWLAPIGTALSGIGAVITGTLLPAIGGIIAAILPFLPIIAGVAAAIAGVILVVRNWGEITDWITEKWTMFKEFISEAIEKIGEVFVAAHVKIGNAVLKLVKSIGDHMRTLKDSALQWGADMIQGFIDGILAKWEALKETVANVANTVKDFLGFSEPSKGPMKNFNDWPRHMMQNYASGIESMRFLVKNAVADVSADVAVLENPFSADEMYNAVRQGASDANVSLAIGDREFGRTLREMGVVFGG